MLPFALLPPEEGKVRGVATPEARFCNLTDTVHGGWIMTMLDTAMSLAAQTTLSADETGPSHETTAKFVRPISATKSATGHLLGAAGGLGAIFTILALRDQVTPPTLNLSTPDAAGDGIDFVAPQSRPLEMDCAICNGFGFGGVNASALFRRWTDNPADAGAGGSRD